MSAIIKGGGDVFGPNAAVADHIPQFSGTTGKILKDGLAAPTGVVVGTTDAQTLANKTLVTPLVQNAGFSYRPSGVVAATAQTISAVVSGGEMITCSFDMPANFMSRDGDYIRITSYWGTAGTTGNKVYRIRVGGVLMMEFSTVAATDAVFTTLFGRFGNVTNALRSCTFRGFAGANIGPESANVSVDLTTPLQVAVIVSSAAGAGNACFTRNVVIEFLPVPA